MAQFERFFKSYQFKTIIGNTLEISLYQLIAGFPMPIMLALLINQLSSHRFKRTLQTITYAPHFVSVPAVAGLILIVLSPSSGGLFYSLIQTLTGNNVAVPMGNPGWFSSIFVISHIWQHCGWDAIIYIAALTAISPDLYEGRRNRRCRQMAKDMVHRHSFHYTNGYHSINSQFGSYHERRV